MLGTFTAAQSHKCCDSPIRCCSIAASLLIWLRRAIYAATLTAAPVFADSVKPPVVARQAQQPTQAQRPTPDSMLDAHVRIVVEPVGSRSRYYGSGVVVFTQPGYTEILTNRHVVAGRGEIDLRIEDNDGAANRFKGAKVELKGGVIFLKDCDLAIIKVIGSPAASGAARIAPPGYEPVGPVYTIGSDAGKAPTIWSASIESLNREEYGERGERLLFNMRIRHTSREGRSGGGVYDEVSGYLVGIIWGSLDSDGMTRAVSLTRIKGSPAFAEVQQRSMQAAQIAAAPPIQPPNEYGRAGPQMPRQQPQLPGQPGRIVSVPPIQQPQLQSQTGRIIAADPGSQLITYLPTSPQQPVSGPVGPLNPNAPIFASPGSLQYGPPRILFFHRSSDPLSLIRTALGSVDTMYLNAEDDNAADEAAKLWGVKTLPAAVVVLSNPDGSYRSLGVLHGAGITLDALRKLASP